MAQQLNILQSYQSHSDVAAHWAGVTPEASANECDLIAFRYNGKHRLGKVHAANLNTITLVMLEDGSDVYTLEDVVYKSFSYEKISYARWVSISEVPDDEV